MAAASIMKNKKIAISRPRFDRFRPNLARWRSLALLSVLNLKIKKIWKLKMAAAAILKNRKIIISRFDRFRPNLAGQRTRPPPSWKIEKSQYLGRGLTDFYFLPNLAWWCSSVLLSVRSVKMSKNLKIQDGGGRHLEKSKNRHISAAFQPISTKCDTVVQFRPCADANWDSSGEWKVNLNREVELCQYGRLLFTLLELVLCDTIYL